MVVARKKNEQRRIEKVFSEEEKWRTLTSEFRAYTKSMRSVGRADVGLKSVGVSRQLHYSVEDWSDNWRSGRV